ncbi:MAG TPA: glycosyltransferase [Bacteroidales bacterium]|nr:glycosyltransferase [Bacteroidales bacterium]
MAASIRPKKSKLLVTLADEHFIQQARQLFSSVYWNAGWDGDYMLLSHDIPEEKLKWFIDKGILIMKCKPFYFGAMGDDDYPNCVLDKLYLFTEEFKKWELVVFLDSDIIVKASLDKLCKTKRFSSPQTCNKNFWDYFSKDDCNVLENLQKEYNLYRPAFNSGVISFDTRIIEHDTVDRLISIFKKYAKISNGDDSILNLFFYDQWEKIPLVYNSIAYSHDQKKHKAIILHFNNPVLWQKKNLRPWDKGNLYYEEWKTNLDKAEFIDLNKKQRGKKWNIVQIYYYSFVLKTFFFKYRIKKQIKSSPFRIKMASFLRYKLPAFFDYIKKTPDRLIGKIGMWIKKNNAGLYNKLVKIKGRK